MINDIQRRILAEAAKFGGSDVSGAQIIANQLNEANYQSWTNDSAGGVSTFGFGKAQFEGKMRQLLVKMGFEKGINKMDINGNKMVLYFANRAKANDFVITFNGLVKRSSKGSPATLSTSFDKIKSPAGTNAVVTVDFSMMKTEDLENGSDVFVMLEALYENSIEEAKTKNTHVTSVPAGASEKEFAKARAANPYRVRLGKGVPAGAKNEEAEIEEAKAKIKYLTGPGKRDSKRIIGIYTMQGKWIKDMNTEKEAMNFVNKSWGESVEEKVKNIEESATKAALEDFMYDLPKAAIEELRPVMKMKQGVGRMAKITAVLKKHGVTQKLMGSYPAAVVNDYFDTFHGESVEEALAPSAAEANIVIGHFIEKSKGNRFEYRKSQNDWGKKNGYPHEVWVSSSKTRSANVKGTVCYIVTDEDGEGNPVVDKWMIKSHFKYVKAD